MPTKLQKFAEFKQFQNCFSYLYNDYLTSTFHLYGQWHNMYFQNNNPIVIEIGCGRGEYSIGLAEKYPYKNFIGIDFKSNRMWAGAKQSLEKKLHNVAFIRSKVEFLDKVFEKNEVSEIWITFPDPYERKSRAKKRLTHPRFLTHYKKFLKDNGIIHLKTDNDILFNFTLDVLQKMKITPIICSHNLYEDNSHPILQEVKSIQTYYEQLFVSQRHTIKYCQFQLS